MINPETELTRRLSKTSFRELAKEMDVSHAYLFEVATGKRPIGPKILKGLGLRKVITYERVK